MKQQKDRKQNNEKYGYVLESTVNRVSVSIQAKQISKRARVRIRENAIIIKTIAPSGQRAAEEIFIS